MRIPVLLGTAREGRESEKVARLFFGELSEGGVESEIIDVRDYRVGATDNSEKREEARRFRERIRGADALIIVSPEYNHSFPGELKMALDLAYGEYGKKPVGVAGVSSGPIGGARMVEQLRIVLAAFGMVQAKRSAYFPNVQALFDKKGRLLDTECAENARKLVQEVVALAKGCGRK